MTTRSPMAMGGAPVVEGVTEGIASLALPELGPATKPNPELYPRVPLIETLLNST